MQKLLFSLALTAFSISNAPAQVSIAPVAGLNVSGYSADQSEVLANGHNSLKLGPCLGVLLDVHLKSKWSLQTGLLYKMNGSLSTFNNPFYDPSQHAPLRDDYVRLSVKSLDVPVKFIYSLGTQKGGAFFIGGGAYVAVNIGETGLIHSHRYDANALLGAYDVHVKLAVGSPYGVPRMDLGAGMNVGYRATKGLLICLQGQYGALNQGDANSNARNYNFGAVVGYSFKLKHKTQLSEARSQDKH